MAYISLNSSINILSYLVNLCIRTNTTDILLSMIAAHAPNLAIDAYRDLPTVYGDKMVIHMKIAELDEGIKAILDIWEKLNTESKSIIPQEQLETVCKSSDPKELLSMFIARANGSYINLSILPHMPACWVPHIVANIPLLSPSSLFSSYGNLQRHYDCAFVNDLIKIYIHGADNTTKLRNTINTIMNNMWGGILYEGKPYPDALVEFLKDDTFLKILATNAIFYNCIYYKKFYWNKEQFMNAVGYNRIVNILIPNFVEHNPYLSTIITSIFNISQQDVEKINNSIESMNNSLQESTTFSQFFENYINPDENENLVVQELNGETINQIPNPDRIFQIFEKEYLESTGQSWNKNKFMSRAADWNFYGNTNGFVTIRKQNSGFVKLVGAAGAMKSKYLGFKKIKDLNYPLWGLVSKDIAQLLIKMGGYRSPNMVEMMLLKANISKTVLGDAEIKEYTKDGGIVINYPDVGIVTKYFVGSDAYYKKLYSLKHLMPK